ncbi:hypothetical protein DS62_13190 [Smithella sp. SC_K08D17]|jgi:hypothetical protein|nr:hypothetical protein DS62_13190 [Smithella sp. SC_K08D17]
MEQQNSYDLIKQSMGLRLDNIIQLGCKLLMYDNAYHKKPPPTDEEVRCMILSVINKSTNKNCKSKIKPYAEWTEQERIEPAVDRFNALNEESKEKFYERLTAYTRFYSFISQIIPYES